jgi:hypothetical protein
MSPATINRAWFFMQSFRNICPIVIKSEISRQILMKASSIKFYQNPSIGSRADRQTEREMVGQT